MKIVHITSYFQPGMGYQENCLCPAQARLGHEVTIITSDRYPPYPGGYKAMMGTDAPERIVAAGTSEVDDVKLLRLPAAWEWTAHNWVWLRGLWRSVEAEKPDIVHAHNFVTVPVFQFLWRNRRRKYPVVMDDHNNYFNIEPYTFEKRAFYAMVKHLCRPVLIRSVGRVLPMSEEVETLIEREYGISRSMSTLVYLGADADRFRRDRAAGDAVRKELGIPPDAVVVLTAGKLTRSKDAHLLVEAMQRVCEGCPRAWLLLIGNAPRAYREELEHGIAGGPLAKRVTWVDFVKNSELPAYYSAGDIGVWPGDWSNTVLEAAACSLALVLPHKEYAKYSMMNRNGLAFERGNAEQLAARIIELVSDDAQREEMGRRSRELIETRLNWDTLARQTIDIYEEVIRAAARADESPTAAEVQSKSNEHTP